MGAFSPTYPRNLILRRGLEELGVEVLLCQMPTEGSTPQRALRMRRQFREMADQCDVIVLAEFNTNIAWMAWWLATWHRKKLIIDVLISVYATAVNDRHTVKPYAPKAIYYWLMDWFALHLPDFALADTPQHRDLFIKTYNANPERVLLVPLSAPREVLEVPATPPQADRSGIDILFYGSYIQHHGIDTILRAAALLSDRPDLKIELIGAGQIDEDMAALANELGITNVTFTAPMPFNDLLARAGHADILLGTFGTTPNMETGIGNKIFQAWAMGKALITADTAPVRTFMTPGEHMLTIPAGDPEALAEAIRVLADDPDRREAMGQSARETFKATYTERHIAAMLAPYLS